MNKNVVVDIDGVLADFEGLFIQKFGEERRELESLESRYPTMGISINRFVNHPETYKYLEPIPLGLSIVEYLTDNGWDVDIVTSRPADAEWVTRRWLKEHGVNFLSFSINPNKSGRIAELAPVCAIDDLISVARLLKRYSVPVLLMQQPWNWFFENKKQVFSNLSQFIMSFNELIQEKE